MRRNFGCPPCVPKSSKVFAQSSHPQRVPIVVSRQTPPLKTTTYYVVPEYKPPRDDTGASIEATHSGAKAWQFQGDETMHSFWAVPRVSALEVQKSVATSEPFAINMGLRTKRYQSVVVGTWHDKPVNAVFAVDVPFLVNSDGLANGALLYWESAPKAENSKRQLNWKDAVVENCKKAKAKAASKTKARAGKGGVLDLDEI